jgi:hypothetical protein
MRPHRIAIVLLLTATGAAAQDEAPRQGTGGRGYFGAPVVRWTTVREQGVVMFGGRGAWNVSPSFLIGGSLYGTMSEIDAPQGVIPDSPGPLDVKFENFGIDLEYVPQPKAPTHLTVGVFIGGGAGHYVRDKTHEQHGETDFMLLLEPAVGVEQRVVDWIHLNLAASYRMVSGAELPGLADGDFNGGSAALAVKCGRF